MKSVHVTISGRVQGVFFRAETERTAESLNLTGWVRNRSDGSVEAVFEGEDKAVYQMVVWCHSGPRFARVDDVIIEDEPYTGKFQNFRVRY
ncbi:MAG: acylphosphatase [Deltaproteobacteria bacterium HGW-Deltaproteobacteria-6]|nr:MAG: acylphosphatase [Deltaproteobacteria bacterium HGW-Deltaproteobacteria-6]